MKKGLLSLALLSVITLTGCGVDEGVDSTKYTFRIVGGEDSFSEYYTIEEFKTAFESLEDPTSDRYEFLGYFNDRDRTDEFSVDDFDGDTTVYIKWGIKGVNLVAHETDDDILVAKSAMNSKATEIYIPEELNDKEIQIAEYGFKDDTYIQRVIIEEADVSTGAFYGCTGLTHVVLDSPFIGIYENAFALTENVKVAYSARINSAVVVEEYAFGDLYDFSTGEFVSTAATNAELYYTESESLATIRSTFKLTEEEGVISIFFSGQYLTGDDGLPTGFYSAV